MKKIKFAVQIFVLAASFPLLLISGINTPAKKTSKQEQQINDSPAIKKSLHKEDCVCKNESKPQKVSLYDMLFKN